MRCFDGKCYIIVYFARMSIFIQVAKGRLTNWVKLTPMTSLYGLHQTNSGYGGLLCDFILLSILWNYIIIIREVIKPFQYIFFLVSLWGKTDPYNTFIWLYGGINDSSVFFVMLHVFYLKD